MNKNSYKRHQVIKNEIANIRQDLLDSEEELKGAYIERNLKKAKYIKKRINLLLGSLYTRETIQGEILLPQQLKIENGVLVLEDFWKDNSIEPNNSDFEEFVAMYLTDNYNHNIFGFVWVVKEKDIFVTKIRWNKNQILESDIKETIRGKTQINNDFVTITKNRDKENSVVIVHKESGYVQEANTLKGAIKILRNHYYM